MNEWLVSSKYFLILFSRELQLCWLDLLRKYECKKDQDEAIKMDGVIWAVARIDRVE